MHISKQGWLEKERHCPSPHFNQRPINNDISLLVIHNISLPPGQFGTPFVDDLFLGQLDPNKDSFFEEIYQLTVSAHCLISRTGEVTQYVSFKDRAWHAGVSTYCGKENCNDFSIGIELEGTDKTEFSPAQYQALVKTTRQIITLYPKITPERIVGHSDIAPGRKTDPGVGFDWDKYKQQLAKELT